VPNSEIETQELYQSWLSNPTPALCVRLAGVLRRSGRPAEALDVTRKGLKEWPENISVNVVFGRCALDANLLEEAMQVFEKVIAIDPLNLIAIKSLAELHFAGGNWNRCIELCEEYLFEYPGDPEIEEMLGKARTKKEEFQREARITGQDVNYPDTERMASVLAAQKPVGESAQEVKESHLSQHTVPEGKSRDQERAPRSLFDLFSNSECEELGLTSYDK